MLNFQSVTITLSMQEIPNQVKLLQVMSKGDSQQRNGKYTKYNLSNDLDSSFKLIL